jgi:hypothetical protein
MPQIHLSEDELKRTDFLISTLNESEDARKQVFQQMLSKLEDNGACRAVYHKLAFVLFRDTLGEW